MNKLTYFLLLAITLSSCKNKESKVYDLVILNARIINVENESVSEAQSIFISDGEIVEVRKGVDKEQFTADRLIDADGKFVMPGLWDNHVHFRGGDTLVEENKDLLPLFLAYGITTVRDAGGDITPNVLKWEDQIEKGELDGPRIFSSGPKLDGDKPAWPGSIKVTGKAEIVAALDSLESLEVDYVKTYDGNLSQKIITALSKKLKNVA